MIDFFTIQARFFRFLWGEYVFLRLRFWTLTVRAILAVQAMALAKMNEAVRLIELEEGK